MYITIITFALCIALMLWGGKFAGFNGAFNDDFMSLKVTKSLRGLAALGVLLHHVAQEYAFSKAHELKFFSEIGVFFVAVFLFCSGYGLLKSYDSKPDYMKDFVRNRMLKTLVIPFYVNAVLYALFTVFFIKEYTVPGLVCGLLGFSLLNGYAWFPIVLTILYLTFYLLFRKPRNRGLCFAVIAAVALMLAAIFCVLGHFPWYAGRMNWWLTEQGWANAKWWMTPKLLLFSGEWWVNTAPAFIAGMLFAQYEKPVTSWFKRLYWLKLACLAVLCVASYILYLWGAGEFGYWSEWSGKGPGIINKAVTYCCQVPCIVIITATLFAAMMKYHAENPVTQFFGRYSLDMYLMNFMAINVFYFLLYKGEESLVTWPHHLNLALYEVCVVAASIGLGLLFRFLYGLVNKAAGLEKK